MRLTILTLLLCFVLAQSFDFVQFLENYENIKETSKSRKIMKELPDCGKRHEGWRFSRASSQYCLWDCEEETD